MYRLYERSHYWARVWWWGCVVGSFLPYYLCDWGSDEVGIITVIAGLPMVLVQALAHLARRLGFL